MPTRSLLSFILLALTASSGSFILGCTSSANFEVGIRNSTNLPVEISLAKQTFDGSEAGPYEPDWATPEDLALRSSHGKEKWDGPVVPPGRTLGWKIQGRFNLNTRGMVRCYWGEMTISQMLACSDKSPDRVDVPLQAGRNIITLIEREGRLAIQN